MRRSRRIYPRSYRPKPPDNRRKLPHPGLGEVIFHTQVNRGLMDDIHFKIGPPGGGRMTGPSRFALIHPFSTNSQALVASRDNAMDDNNTATMLLFETI